MEEEPADGQAADAERERRWATLPPRVRLEDTFIEQPVSSPPELPDAQDVERDRATRYAPGL